MMGTKQQSFTTPLKRSREVLRRLSKLVEQHDHVNLAVSGGTDSIVAADVFARLGPEYGFEPDRVVHINTGAAIPQTELTARIVAQIHGLDFHKQGYRNRRNAIGPRVLRNGWPAAYGGHPSELGHGREWANRKDKPMDAVYANLDGYQVWVSGARKLESGKRQGNVPDSGIEEDKARRTWVQIIGGWTEAEKQEYIKERGLPVSESYVFLGFSGECTACSFDRQSLLNRLWTIAPELAYSIQSLAVWLYQKVRYEGDFELEAKRLCWGWEPDESTIQEPETESDTAQDMVGCDAESCSGEAETDWIRGLSNNQLVTRQDVLKLWNTETVPQRFPIS